MLAELVSRRRIRFGAAVVAALLVAGCAAGQQAETADESPTLDGTNADVGHMALRGIAIEAPHGIAYQPGSTATLKIVLVNRGSRPDRLTSITTPAAAGWAAYGARAVTASSPAAGSQVLKPLSAIPIPAGTRVSYGVPDAGGTLVLTKVKKALHPGSTVDVTFTFADSGSVHVPVPVQLSTSPNTAVLPGPSATGQVG